MVKLGLKDGEKKRKKSNEENQKKEIIGKLVTVAKGDQKAPFSIATTPNSNLLLLFIIKMSREDKELFFSQVRM